MECWLRQPDVSLRTEPHKPMSEEMVYQLREENQEVSLCFHDNAYLNLKDIGDKKHFHKQPIFSPLFS
jgi:hypothetical protein